MTKPSMRLADAKTDAYARHCIDRASAIVDLLRGETINTSVSATVHALRLMIALGEGTEQGRADAISKVVAALHSPLGKVTKQ